MNETNYLELTNCAISVLNLTKDEIRHKFPDHPVCFIEFSQKMNSENLIEIRFDKEKNTLTCTFDEEMKCNSSYLFIDEEVEIKSYVEYLKNKFFYDYLGSRWMIYNYVMSVKKIDGIICFMFYRC